MKIYRATVFGSGNIETVEAERVSDSSVWVKERRGTRRHLLRSDYGLYTESRDEAIQFVLDYYRGKVRNAEQALKYAENQLVVIAAKMRDYDYLPDKANG